MKADLIEKVRTMMEGIDTVKDVVETQVALDSEYIKRCIVEKINMADGSIRVVLDVDDKYYYEMLSELIGENVASEYQLISVLKEMSRMRREYTKVLHAMESVRLKGYGVVTPERAEIRLEKPEVIKHGNKFGVKIRAESPSIHMINCLLYTSPSPRD